MGDDEGAGEEIYGAPPVVSGAEVRERRLAETVTINRYLYQQVQQMEHMLMEAADLQAFLEVLLISMPRHFSLPVAELWLYDPESILSGLIDGGQRYGYHLQLHQDAFVMQELYQLEPDIVLVDATDPRMFEVLKADHGLEYALLMPMMESARLMGSLHLGLQDESMFNGSAEEDLIAHLGTVISTCFLNTVKQGQISQLTMLDPLTQISNLRGFRKDIAREIARARRADQALSILMIEIDEYEDLFTHYGENTAHFTVKKTAQRVSSDLRATDLLARLSGSRIAVLLPACSEMMGVEIAERMRKDIDEFSVDDGRGAVIDASVSIGVVTWEPQQFPAIDMPALAEQMQTVAIRGLDSSLSAGGNQVSVSRLSVQLV
jgi:diguanylate cyclase (GGDEF)-like protein